MHVYKVNMYQQSIKPSAKARIARPSIARIIVMSTQRQPHAVTRGRRHHRLQALLGTTAVASALGLAMLQPTAAKADPPQQQVTLPSGAQSSVPATVSSGADHTGKFGETNGDDGGGANGWGVTQPANSAYTLNAPVQVSATGGGGGDAEPGNNYAGGKGGDAGAIDYTAGAPSG